VPLRWKLGPLQKLSSSLASAARMSEGMFAVASTLPRDLLELYSFEASPFTRPVRDLLCDLELPYILRSCGRTEIGEWLPPKLREHLDIVPESELPNRIALQEKEGRMGIPYLFDPNTNTGMFESAEIIAYLRKQYALDEAG